MGDPSEMDNALFRINYEVSANVQWIATTTYNFSFKEFATSTESVETLAKAFLLNYERPADQSVSVQNYRASLANYYYGVITGGDIPFPDDPDDTEETTKNYATFKKKFNFILFGRSRQWKNRIY